MPRPELVALRHELGQIATRSAPLREAILLFVSEPRTAREIAEHIHRPVPTTTGHLNAARERGLVKRIAYATYVRSDYTGAVPPGSATVVRRSDGRASSIRARLLRLLVEPRRETELCRLADATLTEIRRALHGLWLNGFLIGDSATGFRLRKHAWRENRRPIRNVRR